MSGPKTRAELDAIKLKKFRALVQHANARAPYYANIIRERGINPDACTPADFPVLTKTLLMQNFDAIVTDRRITKQVVADFLTRSSDPMEQLFDEVTVMHTSGTSGEVGYFLYSPGDRAGMNISPPPRSRAGPGALLRRTKAPLQNRAAIFSCA